MAHLRLNLCEAIDCSTPGFPVHHQFWELAQTRPLSWWCRLIISSSVIPSSSCLQSFPASGSFKMSQLFTLGGHSFGVSASASVLPKNTQRIEQIIWDLEGYLPTEYNYSCFCRQQGAWGLSDRHVISQVEKMGSWIFIPVGSCLSPSYHLFLAVDSQSFDMNRMEAYGIFMPLRALELNFYL